MLHRAPNPKVIGKSAAPIVGPVVRRAPERALAKSAIQTKSQLFNLRRRETCALEVFVIE
jgi:hypothetical protein